MSVLIAYASTRSWNADVAGQIADRLLKAGIAATARPVSQVANLQQHRAVVLGSPLHDRDWLPEAVDFLCEFSEALLRLPVWLFSTEELGEVHSPRREPQGSGRMHESVAVARARQTIRIRDHRHFEKSLARGNRSQLRDLLLKVCGGSPDDRRDWREINEWAGQIARQLQAIDHERERRRLHLSVRGKP